MNKKKLSEIVNSENKWLFLYDIGPLSPINMASFSHQQEFSVEKVKRDYIFLSLLMIISALKAINIFLLQFFCRKYEFSVSCSHLLVTAESNYRHRPAMIYLEEKNIKDHIAFDSFNKKSYTRLSAIGIKDFISIFLIHFKQIDTLLSYESSKDLRKVIKNNAFNVAVYSYFCVLFKNLKVIKPDLTMLSSANLVSLASIRADITTHFFAHGLIRKEHRSKFPDYHYFHISSEDEEEYIYKNFLKSKVTVFPIDRVKVRSKKVLIFLHVIFHVDDIEGQRIRELILFFKAKGYEIILKGHPENETDNINIFAATYGAEILPNEDISTNDLINREQPSFIVGARTTVLCLSLRAGIIPVSISDKDHFAFDYMLYPMPKRVFFWKEDFDNIEKIVDQNLDYSEALESISFKS